MVLEQIRCSCKNACVEVHGCCLVVGKTHASPSPEFKLIHCFHDEGEKSYQKMIEMVPPLHNADARQKVIWASHCNWALGSNWNWGNGAE